MNLARCLAIGLLLCAVGGKAVVAHGPTPKKALETIEIAKSPKEVWDLIKDFDAIGQWHPSVKSVTAQGGNGNGAERTLTLANGDVKESLDDYRAEDMSYSYRLMTENFEAMPVSFYSATITVLPTESGSKVEWLSRFYRADTGNFPPEHLNDEAAINAMTKFLRDGLEGIKAKLAAAK